MSKSLLDGIEFGEKRKAVDADWTKARKIAVGTVATLLAIGALGAGGYYAWQNRPVSLPKTADEAVAVINSGRVDRLNADRKRQYYAEASRLMEDVPQEERREMFRDEESREAMRQVMMEQMDNSMREIARGNVTFEQWAQQMRERWANRRPPEGQQRAEGERPEGPPEGERPSEADRREQMVSRMESGFQNGDGQRMGLMMAFRQRMGNAMRGGPGGRGGPPPGNRNGGN
ncbi:MAG: hypothetical protein KDA31_11570 [Phycisphaerales bacterium]|nr:hypothetical protein [Phycisphaerales bacterium]MCB9836168.1 hypothetical protein [Phycisphaera sp.]